MWLMCGQRGRYINKSFWLCSAAASEDFLIFVSWLLVFSRTSVFERHAGRQPLMMDIALWAIEFISGINYVQVSTQFNPRESGMSLINSIINPLLEMKTNCDWLMKGR